MQQSLRSISNRIMINAGTLVSIQPPFPHARECNQALHQAHMHYRLA